MIKPLKLYSGNDQIVLLNGVRDGSGPVAGASINGNFLNREIPISQEPIVFADVPGQAGNYQATIAAATTPKAGFYTLMIDGIAHGAVMHLEVPCNFIIRQS